MKTPEERIKQLEAEKAAMQQKYEQVVNIARRLDAEKKQMQQQLEQGSQQEDVDDDGGGGQPAKKTDVDASILAKLERMASRMDAIEKIATRSASKVIGHDVKSVMDQFKKKNPVVEDIYGFDDLLAGRIYANKQKMGLGEDVDLAALAEMSAGELAKEYTDRQEARNAENLKRAEASQKAEAVPEYFRQFGMTDFKPPANMEEAKKLELLLMGAAQ